MKRTFDTLVSTLILVLFSPLFLLAYAISALFLRDEKVRNEYVGRNGETFFMTFYMGKMRPVGIVLSIATVLFHVMKGDMAFVGPVPRSSEYTDNMFRTSEEYAEILKVKPGIIAESSLYICSSDHTDLLLIKGDMSDRSADMSVMDADVRYVHHASFLYDIDILKDGMVYFLTDRIGWNYSSFKA